MPTLEEGSTGLRSAVDATAEVGSDAGVESGTTSREDLAGGDGAGGPPVDPALENATGETEVIVRFEEARNTPGASANSVSELQNHAEQTQSSFERYARTTDAVEIQRSFWITNAMLVQMNASELPPGQLLQFQNVERVHRNFEVRALSTEADPLPSSTDQPSATAHGGTAPYNGTYGLHVVNATRTWEEFGTMGGGVNVTVLDTGVNTTSTDIDISAWAEVDGYGNVVDTNVSNATDSDGHGTHVSGTVAGGNASGQYIGVAPNATLKHGQVIPGGGGSFAQIVGGMEWATNDTDSDVITMSLGATGYHSELIAPVRNVRDAGIPLFVATGNVGEWNSDSPGNVYESISVGAVDSSLDVAGFSNGEWIDTSVAWDGDAPDSWPSRYTVPDVVAPGVDVLSINGSSGAYEQFNGTSMATPHVAGVAALVLSVNGTLNDSEVERTISETAFEPHNYEEPDHRYGTGVVDALNATASVTRNTTVSGWVTNATSGAGIADALVETEYGLRTRTNATGYYEFEVPSNNQTITADPLGFEANGTAVNATGQASVQQNITVSTEIVEARIVERQARYTNSSAGLNVSYRVANVGNYNSSLFYHNPLPTPSTATLRVDGNAVSFGQNVSLGIDGPTTVNISVTTNDGYFGILSLEQSFYGEGGSGVVADTIGPSTYHDDPVEIPEDLNPSALQTPIDYVEKNTTLVLNDTTTYEEQIGTYLGSGTYTAIILRNRVSLAAANGADPLVNFTDVTHLVDIGLLVSEPDTSVTGITFDGNGATGVLDVEATGAEIRNATIRDGADGIYLGTGVTDAISNNRFQNLLNGVYADGGDVRSVDNNTATGIADHGIHLPDSWTPNTTIADNDLTIDSGATAGINASTNVSSISGNQITLNGSSADGIATGGAPESTGTVTIADNVISGGYVGIEVGDPGADVIRNNSISDTQWRGISVGWTYRSSATVAENDIRNVDLQGIVSDPSINTVFHNNTIDGVGQFGIEIRDNGPTSDSNVTISNNTIVNVDPSGGHTSRAVLVFQLGNAEIVDNNVSDGRIRVESGANVTARRNTVTNAPVGFDVTRNSSNVRSEHSTFTDVGLVFQTSSLFGYTPTNVTFADANVTTANGTVHIADVPAEDVDVTNLSLADGTRVDASGHNASLELGQDPSNSTFPADYGDIGAFLNLSEEGPGSQIDVNVTYDDADASGLREDTLEVHRYNGTGWETVSTTGVDTATNDVWASVTSFSTFAPLAEETQGTFNVTSVESNASTVLEGETVQVNATINNTGDRSGTQNVTLDVNGSVGTVDHENVTLDPGNETTVSLNWTTQSGQAGDYDATVTTAQDTNSTAVRVDAPANFSVNVTGSNSPVQEGETLDVNATIENVGDRNATQTVNLTAGGTQRDSQSLTVNATESKHVTLQWATTDGDAGDYTANVSSENDTDGASVTVQEPANFSVTNVTTNAPVTEGETLDVSATIENVGDVEGTQTINLTVDGTEETTQSLTLNAGESSTETLSWTTTAGDNGTHTVAINSENDSASTTVTVQTPANFSVQIDDTNSAVVEGDTLQVNATVNNTGGTTATQNVTLALNGTQEDSESVSLNGGENQSVTLNWSTTDGDAGDYTAAVNTSNDSATTSVTVQEPANFSVTAISSNAPVTEGANLTVDATIQNVGDVSGTRNITLALNDSVGVQDYQSVSLGAGNQTTLTLNWTTAGGDAGDYNATVNASDDSNATSVRVDAPAYFAVESVTSPNAPVVEGETLQVNATINNTGDLSATQNVTLELNGSVGVVDNQSVSLGAESQTTIALNWTTADGDVGDYTASVNSSNESTSTSVRVDEPANFSVTVDSTNSPVVENDTLQVNATIQNVGDRNGSQTVNLSINGSVGEVDNQTITLDVGESTTHTFNWTTGSGDNGNYTATVNSANASASSPVEVLAPANFTVNVTGSNSPVTEGDTLQVNATVNNTGDVAATQNVTLELNGTGDVASQNVTLDGGNAIAIALNWTTDGRDAGNYTATVASDDGNDTVAVEIQDAAVYFEVSNVSAPGSITEGDSYTVTANVTNVGSANATQNVSYLLGGTVQTTETNVSLNASERVEVTFSATNGTPGEYTQAIRTANETVATANLTVNAESSGGGGGGGGGVFLPPPSDDGGPSFTITSIDLASDEVGVGESVSVDVRVDNDGNEDGEYTATLTADGQTVDSETLSINANWHETFTLSATFDEAGTYQLAIDGESAGTVTVTGAADLVVTDRRIDATEVDAGQSVTVTTIVSNEGSGEGSRTVELVVGGETVASETVTLAPGESATVTLEHTFAESGSYDVSLGGEQLQTVEVSESQADDGSGDGDGGAGGDGGGDDGGFPVLLVLGVLGVLVAAGSIGFFVYGDELAELLGE
ncbi:peptidase S8/S53 subtilisin kexin sedolisin [Salinarchaeum sp. Harcht-Bsk1]|uniref:CARDB domain-containing protein n=1 Tax=Salinarchaeum sp. Harcht-Bsk1 TaxID=1333523 RepID=UPI000342421D|nr:CARDB domain-containing protein [Salinarchaeum sp. Harcht-Bsk1]AGN01442.1 peptidase S8/S53 subtilisin kexin sedolisin [Salinarchaeum sp. Harcht-Bsk1]